MVPMPMPLLLLLLPDCDSGGRYLKRESQHLGATTLSPARSSRSQGARVHPKRKHAQIPQHTLIQACHRRNDAGLVPWPNAMGSVCLWRVTLPHSAWSMASSAALTMSLYSPISSSNHFSSASFFARTSLTTFVVEAVIPVLAYTISTPFLSFLVSKMGSPSVLWNRRTPLKEKQGSLSQSHSSPLPLPLHPPLLLPLLLLQLSLSLSSMPFSHIISLLNTLT